MVFSKSCEYALRAVLFISQFPGRNVGIREIAGNINIPVPYLKKLLQILAKRGILKSIKGPGGGFIINPALQEPKLLHVVEAIDGPDIFNRCGIGQTQCHDHQPCPIHFRYCALRKDLKNLLTEKTLYDYGRALQAGQYSIGNMLSSAKKK